MKKLGNYFVLMAFACMLLCYSSCGDDNEESNSNENKSVEKKDSGNELSDDENETGSFIEYTVAKTFKEVYTSYSGLKVLIDTRSKNEYDYGHIEGAINVPATKYNTSSNDSEWCNELLTNYSTETCLFFYGPKSSEMVKSVAGRASAIGYGKENSRIFSDDYDELKEAWEELDPFIKYADPTTFYNTYSSYTGAKALIDIRSAEDFAAGALPDAVNFPATMQNTSSNDAEWCQEILAAYSTNTCLFFYGTTNFTLSTTVGGRASKLGYGKQNVRVLEKGYSELVKIWK